MAHMLHNAAFPLSRPITLVDRTRFILANDAS